MTRQLGEDVPGDLVVEVGFAGRADTACERLTDIRSKPGILIPDRTLEITSFRLSRSTPMGTKRSGVRGAFVPTVLTSVATFYGSVVQALKPWPPPVPVLPAATVSEAAVVADDTPDDGVA